MIKKTLLSTTFFAFTMATAGAAYANDNANAGGYIGASVGSTSLPSEFDDSSTTSFGISAGYRVNDNFAFEGSYLNLGTADLSTSEVISGVQVNAKGEIEITGINLGLVGIAPVSERFDLYGKVGVFMWDADLDITATGSMGGVTHTERASESESGTDLSFGVGGQFHVTDNFAIAGEFTRYDLEGDALDNISVVARFKF